jgi:threonine dehydrogenase-like Zn-dependent dehydrogenase
MSARATMVDTARAAVLVEPRRFEYMTFDLPLLGRDDGLLEVEACGLCGTDYEQYQGHLQGVMASRPIIPGHEIVGRIRAVGAEAARRWGVEAGDRVAVEPIIPCGSCRDCLTGFYTRCATDQGYGLYQTVDVEPRLWGGYATHVYLHPRAVVHRLPDDIPADLMTVLNPLSNAIRWATEVPQSGPGTTLVIQGPGQRGLCALVAALDSGASAVYVIGTGRDRQRLELAVELGATGVIDSDREDPVEAVAALTSGRMADVVLDVSAASPTAVATCARMARRGGEVVLAGLNGHKAAEGFITDHVVFNEIRLLGVLSAGYTSVAKAIDLIGSGRHRLDLLCTHTFDLEEAEEAILTLGRERSPEREPVHITLAVQH